MSLLSRIVEDATAQVAAGGDRKLGPAERINANNRAGREPMAGFTDQEREEWLRFGSLSPPRRLVVHPNLPVEPASAGGRRGLRGLSNEAVGLFDRVQRAGGTLSFVALRSKWHPSDLAALVAELEAADGLVERVQVRPATRAGRAESHTAAGDGGTGAAIRISFGFEDALLVSGGWSRFEDGR